ncbi:hypothetical protein QX776_04205 [Alteromonadaceae bacterium BrNp21-10]|nr:hypothetical protein [Alteromonadaceae bacterium BrNp21-10]
MVVIEVWFQSVPFRSPLNEAVTFTELHKAADSGDWATYTKLMGGVFCIRKSQAIHPYYEMELNKETGLIKTSWFDGLITKKLKGILYQGKEIITRIHQWKLDIVRQGFSPSLGVL